MESTEISKILLNNRSCSAYLQDDNLLVYSKTTEEVHAYEGAQVTLLFEIDELLLTQSAESIKKRFKAVNSQLVEQILDLLSVDNKPQKIEYEADMSMGNLVEIKEDSLLYQTDNILFAIHYPNKQLRKYLHPIFEHLYITYTDAIVAVMIDFIAVGDRWQLKWNDYVMDMKVPLNRLGTYLQEKMMTATYQSSSYLISLHAGSVSRDESVVIFPAIAESGKTTLTASLLQNGFELFSDEVTVLNSEGDVTPLPFCMNIKEGSWKILDKLYPNLKIRAVHSRFDNQKIRFLPPINLNKTQKKATHLIFPKYTPNSKTVLTPLGINSALAKIQEASYQVQNSMSESKFELILENLLTLPRYSLVYSNTDEAIERINQLIERERV